MAIIKEVSRTYSVRCNRCGKIGKDCIDNAKWLWSDCEKGHEYHLCPECWKTPGKCPVCEIGPCTCGRIKVPIPDEVSPFQMCMGCLLPVEKCTCEDLRGQGDAAVNV